MRGLVAGCAIMSATSVKYEYAYKTSDGTRHVEEMEAPSREAVFVALRARGIKAIKVVAKEGGKANGEVTVVGVKKRVVFGLVIATAIGATVFTLAVNDEAAEDVPRASIVTNTVPVPVAIASSDAGAHKRAAAPLPRQTIPGDRRRLENAPTNLFSHAEERYLSLFAEPGRDFGGVAEVAFPTNPAALMALLNAPVYISDNEFTEYVDLKRMTVGIKQEMRAYIQGGHTVREYLKELVARQKIEMSYREKAEKKLEAMVSDKTVEQEELYDFWLKANAQLQSMGIYALPLPDALRDYQFSFDLE